MPYIKIWALCFGAATIGNLLLSLIALLLFPGYFAALYATNIDMVLTIAQQSLSVGWWIGLLTGIPLSLATRPGSFPKFGVRELFKPVALLYAVAGGAAFLFSTGMFFASRQGAFALDPGLLYSLAVEHHAADAAIVSARLTAGGTVVVGSIILSVWVWRKRRALMQPADSTTVSWRQWLYRFVVVFGVILLFTLCGGLQYFGQSMVAIGNFYYTSQVDLLLNIPPEVMGQAETLTVDHDQSDGTYYALRGPHLFQRTSNPDELPFGYTSQQLDEAMQQHFHSLQHAWCTQPPVFPRLEDDVPHYGFNLYCREGEVGEQHVSGDIPIGAVPPELQIILDAVPSPQQPSD
jgi:hypothetical protein